jgi:HKD family nuclease
MLIIQNEFNPAEIQNGLFDLLRSGVEQARVCSAYITVSGSELLHDALERASGGNQDGVRKTIVASLDFGLTEPDALTFWRDLENCQVLVAGTSQLTRGTLIPKTAFHTKFYLFDRPDGTMGSLIGSANLTNRGLTINSEAAWLESSHEDRDQINLAWENIVVPATPLTDDILSRYSLLRDRSEVEYPTEELEPVPAPPVGRYNQYESFANARIRMGFYEHMWVQSHQMQGGARTQLELPRGAHRFFGADFSDYDYDRVDHIVELILVAGTRRWRDRPLTWHGDNAMERINLPSLAMGGFSYEDSLILFRRQADNTFELRVYPWNSDTARAYVESSRRQGTLFRLGRNSNRFVGFV